MVVVLDVDVAREHAPLTGVRPPKAPCERMRLYSSRQAATVVWAYAWLWNSVSLKHSSRMGGPRRWTSARTTVSATLLA